MKWLTGPALQVLIAGRGMQPGDRILVAPAPTRHRDDLPFRGKRKRIAVVVRLDWDCDKDLLVLAVPSLEFSGTLADYESAHGAGELQTDWLYPENIVGWRRP